MLTALSTMVAGSWDLDLATGQLRLCRRSREFFGLDPDPDGVITESQWVERLHPEDLPKVREAMMASIVQRRPYAERFRTIHPDGSVQLILGIGGPLGEQGHHGRFGGLNFHLRSAGLLARRWMNANPDPLHAQLSIALTSPEDRRLWSRSGASTSLARRARAIIAIRGSRERLLGRSMIGEPGFDLLLALYVRPDEEDRSLSALAEAADVPYSSAARWLGYLVDKGFVDRSRIPGDRRAIGIELTASGRAIMEAFLSSPRVRQAIAAADIEPSPAPDQ